MPRDIKYDKAVTVKLPSVLFEAIQKRVDKKQLKYGKYSEADVIRTAIVKHLKEKGLLDKNKTYL